MQTSNGDGMGEEAHPSSSSAFSVTTISSSSQRPARRRRQRLSAASGRPPPPRSSARVLLIMGPMWAGKSEELLRLHRRSCVAGKRCLLIKHAKDTRYGEEGQDVLITHAGRSQAVTLAATTLAEAESRARAPAPARPPPHHHQQPTAEGGGGVDRAGADPPAPTSLADLFDHVFVDEGQFFEGLRDTVLRWCGEGMDVDVSALDAFADQALWPEIAGLLPFAVKECLTAVCMRCGADNATLTVRRDPEAFRRDRRDPHAIDVGGIKTFEVVCARCWLAAAPEAKEEEGGDNS